jgi:hypothetical protein
MKKARKKISPALIILIPKVLPRVAFSQLQPHDSIPTTFSQAGTNMR